jgi:hypothetical protein
VECGVVRGLLTSNLVVRSLFDCRFIHPKFVHEKLTFLLPVPHAFLASEYQLGDFFLGWGVFSSSWPFSSIAAASLVLVLMASKFGMGNGCNSWLPSDEFAFRCSSSCSRTDSTTLN